MNLRVANVSDAAWRLCCRVLAGLLLSGPALAHEGHGMAGSHWHATDLAGLAIGVAVAAMTWYSRDRE